MAVGVAARGPTLSSTITLLRPTGHPHRPSWTVVAGPSALSREPYLGAGREGARCRRCSRRRCGSGRLGPPEALGRLGRGGVRGRRAFGVRRGARLLVGASRRNALGGGGGGRFGGWAGEIRVDPRKYRPRTSRNCSAVHISHPWRKGSPHSCRTQWAGPILRSLDTGLRRLGT